MSTVSPVFRVTDVTMADMSTLVVRHKSAVPSISQVANPVIVVPSATFVFPAAKLIVPETILVTQVTVPPPLAL